LCSIIFTSYQIHFYIIEFDNGGERPAYNRIARSHFAQIKMPAKRFTVLDAEHETFILNGFELLLDYDTVIYDLDNRDITRTTQNSIFEDFLVLKTRDDSKSDKLRYRQLKAALAQRKSSCDRVNHIYKMLMKQNAHETQRAICQRQHKLYLWKRWRRGACTCSCGGH